MLRVDSLTVVAAAAWTLDVAAWWRCGGRSSLAVAAAVGCKVDCRGPHRRKRIGRSEGNAVNMMEVLAQRFLDLVLNMGVSIESIWVDGSPWKR